MIVQEKLQNGKMRRADELFDRIKYGDQKSLENLYSIYFPRLNDFARKVVRDDVVSQDIVQEVFVKLWEKCLEFETRNIEALLFRMVRNRCIDYIKYLKVEANRIHDIQVSSKYEEIYRIDFVGNEPYVLIEEELKQRIEQTIQSLPERCREVFILSRINGLKNKEIAEKIHINIKNVERHLNRAMQAFRQNFSEELPIAIIILVLKSFKY